MTLPPADARAARVRAALGYRFAGGHSAQDEGRSKQAEALGWTKGNTKALNELLAGDEDRWREKIDVLPEVTGVPGWFFDHGFDRPAAADVLSLHEQRLLDLEGQVAALRKRLASGATSTSTQRFGDEVAEAVRDRQRSHNAPPAEDDATGSGGEAA